MVVSGDNNGCEAELADCVADRIKGFFLHRPALLVGAFAHVSIGDKIHMTTGLEFHDSFSLPFGGIVFRFGRKIPRTL
jgi:hypothetical protein